MMTWLLLPLLGLAVGAFGTLIGAGGGFILVPILLFLYPTDEPALLTSISLAVVFLNAVSGSVAYARQRRIDYGMGLRFAASGVPGAILGAWTVQFVPRDVFNALIGILLSSVGVMVLLLRPGGRAIQAPKAGQVQRTLTDRSGATFVWWTSPVKGSAISFGIGLLSSLFGIGGGIVHVPVLVFVLGFPVHIATATSLFILIIMSLTGVTTHALAGEYAATWQRVLLLGGGIIAGSQLGALLAARARPAFITRALGVALILVGLRLIVRAFGR